MLINNLHSIGGESWGFRLGLSSSIPHSSLVRVGQTYIYFIQRHGRVKTARAVVRLGQIPVANLLSLPSAKPIEFLELSVWLSSYVRKFNTFF